MDKPGYCTDGFNFLSFTNIDNKTVLSNPVLDMLKFAALLTCEDYRLIYITWNVFRQISRSPVRNWWKPGVVNRFCQVWGVGRSGHAATVRRADAYHRRTASYRLHTAGRAIYVIVLHSRFSLYLLSCYSRWLKYQHQCLCITCIRRINHLYHLLLKHFCAILTSVPTWAGLTERCEKKRDLQWKICLPAKRCSLC